MLTHEYPPYVFGGIGTFTHALAHALAREQIEVTVMAGWPARTIKKSVFVGNRAVTRNLKVIRIPRMDLPPSHLWYQLMNLNKLQDYLANVDIVHVQDCASFPIMSYCKRKNSILPWVVTVHTGPVSQLYYAVKSAISRQSSIRELATYVLGFPLWDSAIRSAAKSADALVTVSEDLASEIRNEYLADTKKLLSINTGVDIAELEYYRRMDAGRPSETGTVNIVYAGRLYWCKGILHLLKSLAYLTSKLGFADKSGGEGQVQRICST
jgi:glycosyltransferase involved in cell wall biosynthesis